jgi:hypothetical protein
MCLTKPARAKITLTPLRLRSHDVYVPFCLGKEREKRNEVLVSFSFPLFFSLLFYWGGWLCV